MLSAIPGMAAFVWTAAKGYRLRPWESPYLRWRIETYWGIPARELNRTSFFRFIWAQRSAFGDFLIWAGRMRRDQGR
jgi:hypothetical protein